MHVRAMRMVFGFHIYEFIDGSNADGMDFRFFFGFECKCTIICCLIFYDIHGCPQEGKRAAFTSSYIPHWLPAPDV